MKEALKGDVLLAYPDFSQPVIIHTDASDYQLGAVISQNNKPIALYSRNLNNAKKIIYNKQELLSIIENLKNSKISVEDIT